MELSLRLNFTVSSDVMSRHGKRPYSFPAFEEYRRVNLNKFPYHFLFEVIGESTVRIVVLKHNRRDPDFGLDR